MHRGFFPISFTHTHTLFRRPSLFPSAAPRRSAAAACAHRRQPPTPPLTHDPVLEKHHRDPLQLTDPLNFAFLHPSSIFHSAGELSAPPPLGLAVDTLIQSLLNPAKGTSSTTSTRRSFLAASSLPSDTPASRTPCRHRRRWKPEPPHRRRPLLPHLRPN
jgi:hypothetical protein